MAKEFTASILVGYSSRLAIRKSTASDMPKTLYGVRAGCGQAADMSMAWHSRGAHVGAMCACGEMQQCHF